jgi:hypothetical protein
MRIPLIVGFSDSIYAQKWRRDKMAAISVLYMIAGALGSIFWVWMLIILFANIPGAIVYFIMRQPVAFNAVLPKFVLRITRGSEISRAELDAYNVQNAYNLSKLGDLYFEFGDIKKAVIAYNKALLLDPKDVASLWGAAQADIKNKDYEAAKNKLESLLKIVPEHRYGEASLAHARMLFETGGAASAKKQLIKYLEKWSDPEAKIMMARVLADEGGTAEAGKILEEALMDIKGAPKFYFNKKRKWIGIINALKNRIKETGRR